MRKFILGLEVVTVTLFVISFLLYNSTFTSIVSANIITLLCIPLFMFIYISKIVLNKSLKHKLYFGSVMIILLHFLMSKINLKEFLHFDIIAKLSAILLLVLLIIRTIEKLKKESYENINEQKINKLITILTISSIIGILIYLIFDSISQEKIAETVFIGTEILSFITLLYFLYIKIIRIEKVNLKDIVISFDITKSTLVLVLIFILFNYYTDSISKKCFSLVNRGIEIARIDKNIIMEKGDKIFNKNKISNDSTIQQIDSLFNLEITLFELFKEEILIQSKEKDYRFIKKGTTIRDLEILSLERPYEIDKVNYFINDLPHYFDEKLISLNKRIDELTNQYLISQKVNLNFSKTNAFYSIYKQNMDFIDFPKMSHKDVFAGTYKKWNSLYFKNSCLVTALNQLENMEKNIAQSRLDLYNLFLMVS